MVRIYLIFVLLLASCQNAEVRSQQTKKWMAKDGRVKILSTTAMINDIVTKIVGDQGDTITLIQGNLDPHSYQLVKGDDEKLSTADIIFYNGLGLEHGASLQQYLLKHPQAVALGNRIEKQHPDKILLFNNQVDPHIWMDLALFAESIPFIVEAIAQKDPEHEALYKERGAVLQSELIHTDAEIRQQMHTIPKEKRYLVTSHDAFNYFAKTYLAEENEASDGSWTQRFQAPEGLAPDSQLSSADIQFIINHLKKYRITVLFPESNVSQDSIRKIVNAGKELGLDVLIAKDPLYGDAMGGPGSDGDSYPKMLKHNARTILKYLVPEKQTPVQEAAQLGSQ